MSTNRLYRGLVLIGAAGLLLAAAGAGLGQVGDDAGSRQMKRELRIVESVVDDMLVDSPNWLVRGREPSSAIFVDGVGLVVSFEASLVDRWGWWGDDNKVYSLLGNRFRIERHDDQDDDGEGTEDEDEARLSDKEREARWRERVEKRYDQGRAELRELMIDLAGIADGVPDDQWVIVAASLDRHDLFREKKIEKLTLKARAGELRRLESSSLSGAELTGRIQEESY